MPLYFAYGANMDVPAMAERCPRSKPLQPGRLMAHRFLVTADGYASVMRAPGAVVHGLLWDLALSDVRALDRYEEVGRGLYGKQLQPILRVGGAHRALVYVGRSAERGTPRPGYMEAVVEAAAAAGLPERYLGELRLWLPSAAPAVSARRAIRTRPDPAGR